jgi:PAS domain S-box-containing protein
MLDNILQYAPGWIYWKDRNSIHLGCNEQFAIVAGFKNRKEMIGKSDYECAWGNRAHSYNLDDQEVINSGKPKLNIEDIVLLNNGLEVTVISNKVPLRNQNGEIIGILGIATDITERKKMEAVLKTSMEKTEAANYIMTEFIANMGHDLATPISDVISIAHLLYLYVDEYPEFKEDFEVLMTRSEDCEKVRKHIINATSISNLDVKAETFPISLELLAIESELRPTISSKNLKFIIHPLKPKKEDQIETDRIKFHDVLFDLMSNAINFTEEGQVIVSVLKEGDLFHIKVSDTGIGIPSDKFEYIFQQYTKLSRSNKHGSNFKGVGAGLYLARIRASILNATISVESELNKGSTFTLTIPIHPVKK